MCENLFLTKRFFFSGKGKDALEEMTDPWKETKLQAIESNYAKIDIYNAEELGLFCKALPKKTCHLKNDKCTGDHSKIRVTGPVAANMNGEKVPMFVIGKLKKPRCFRNVKKLPCIYWGQNKSCRGQCFSKIRSERLTIN